MELQAQETLLAGVLAVVLLLTVLQFVVLIKITQIQNNQKNKQGGHNPANNGQKHGNNHNQNKKPDNRPNQNNNRPTQQPQQQQPQQNQPNANKQQQNGAEKKFEKIGSGAQSLKDTNAQLAARPRPQQQNGKPKVYSERTAGTGANTAPTNANPQNPQKQERPANTPIKQQELPKSEEVQQEAPQVIAAQNSTEIKAEANTAEQANSVQYGRR